MLAPGPFSHRGDAACGKRPVEEPDSWIPDRDSSTRFGAHLLTPLWFVSEPVCRIGRETKLNGAKERQQPLEGLQIGNLFMREC